ncbi:MAG: AsmA family protein [Caldimonas sp.]
MPKVLKYTLLSLAVVAVLLAIAAAIFAATFDANAYKAAIVERVQRDSQRTLAIPGDIELHLFPRIGIELGAASLSEHASGESFASVRSARVSLALLPLLRKQAVVDRFRIDGLRLKVTRYPDGRTSVDDFLKPAQKQGSEPANPSAGTSLRFEIAGVSITDASVTLDDQASGRHVELTRGEIETGRIAPGSAGDASFKGHVSADRPRLDADFAVKGSFLLDPAQRRYAVGKLAAELTGRLATLADAKLSLVGDAIASLEPFALELGGIELTLKGHDDQGLLEASLGVPQLKLGDKDIAARKIVARASLKQGRRAWQAQLSLPALVGSGRAFTMAAFDGNLSVDDGPLQAKATLAGAFDGDLNRRLLSSPQSTLTLDGKQGETAIKGRLATPWVIDLNGQTIDLSRIAAEFTLPNPKGGSMALAAAGSAKVGLDKPRLDARLAGKLDESAFDLAIAMSRFSPPVYEVNATIDRIDVDRYRAESRPGQGEAAATSQALPDLSALRELDATGSVRVGTLKAAGIRAGKVHVGLRVNGGRLELNPLDAELYQGRLAGQLSLVAAAPPRLTTKATLSGVSVGPLLKDTLGKASIEGRGNVALDLTTQGGTGTAWKKALDGSARVELRDGSVRGFNIAQILRSAGAKLGAVSAQQAGTASQAESTDFSELSASFRIARGVARNDDLLAKTPLLRVTGNGAVDLGENRLDYLVKATVVATLQGQGGPELQALRGQTVPIRLSGPFAAVGYSVDVAALVEGVARSKLEGKARDATAKAQEQLGERLKGLFGK